MSAGYHDARLPHDVRREIVWGELWRSYFAALVPPDGCVLDLGCGYGSFINTVVAPRRIAVDSWPGFPAHLAPGIEPHVAGVTDLDFLETGSVDFAFASNIFEHISQADLTKVLSQLHRALSARGTLTLLQPNYRYAYKEYFDDYTHVSIWSHESMKDFLTANGYEVFDVQPRFLPLTVKSRLPVSPLLVRAWLKSPIKPGGKQMLIRARPIRD